MLALLLVLLSNSFSQSCAQLYYISADPIVNETCVIRGSNYALRPCYSFHRLRIDKRLLSNKSSVALRLLSERYSNASFVADNVGRLDILPWNETNRVDLQCESVVLRGVVELQLSSVNFASCAFEYNSFHTITSSKRFADLVINSCSFSGSQRKHAMSITSSSRITRLEVSIINCTFSSNTGALFVAGDDPLLPARLFGINVNVLISDTSFLRNRGRCFFAREANVILKGSLFINNTADLSSAIMYYSSGQPGIHGCRFEGNSAKRSTGGAIHSTSSIPLDITNTSFEGNIAGTSGGAIFTNHLKCSGCCFKRNSAGESGGAVYIDIGVDIWGQVKGDHQSSIIDSNFDSNEARSSGGAVYCQKKLVLSGSSAKFNSAAAKGGFLYLSGCHFSMRDEISIADNNATDGGAIYSEDSRLTAESNIFVPIAGRYFGNNRALPTAVIVANSTAESRGGALFLVNSELIMAFNSHLMFDNNTASREGGAVYVLDNKCEAVSSDNRCFIPIRSYFRINETLVFRNNRAELGSMLYGGLLDRCFIERHRGMEEFQQVVPFSAGEVSSDAITICLCVNDRPDCSARDFSVIKIRGEAVNLDVAAVDQVKTPLPASILAHYTLVAAKLGEGEGRRWVNGSCTQLPYHVFTESSSALLVLQPEGFCERSLLSRISVNITIQNCTRGFEQLKDRCTCDGRLPKYLGNVTCRVDSRSVIKTGFAWFRYDDSFLKIHTSCPLDYCHISPIISLSAPNEQCANQRSGIMCGACRANHSVALGGSKCLPCGSRYTFIWLLAVFAAAGVALVALLLVCNMTISAGTLNGIIFYANVVSISGLTGLRSCSTHPILSVFVAWLNLDFGVETCFYPGMDTYQKTWLQLVFPLYIFMMVAAIIVASYYSSRAMRVFGRNNIAILATLFLLSYSKLLKTIITALASTKLLVSSAGNVSDAVWTEKVWTYDENIEYLKGKHVALFTVALLLLIFLFLPYTFLLTFGQCIRSMPVRRRWVARLTRSTAFISIMDAYHAPYKRQHRYWTGFLLLTRCVLFLATASVSNITLDMYITTLVTIGILTVKTCTVKIYRNSYLDMLEFWFLLNLIILTSTLSYVLTNSSNGGVACKCITSSLSVNLFVFFGILGYHGYLQLQKTRCFARIKQGFLGRWPVTVQHAADIEEHVLVSSETDHKKQHTTTMVELREQLLASDKDIDRAVQPR